MIRSPSSRTLLKSLENQVRSKILLVGYCPSHRGSPSRPLDGPGTGHRLAKLCGLSHEEYLKTFDRINLHYETPLKRDSDTRAKGRLNAVEVLRRKNEKMIILGREVLQAFGAYVDPSDCPIASWFDFGSVKIAYIPHPSGLNRYYNDSKNTKLVERFLRSTL